MTASIHPGAAILKNLGIDAKNVLSFSVECAGHDRLPTITLNQHVLGTPEPTYRLTMIEVTAAEPIGFDLDAACQGAQTTVAQAITATYRKARQLVSRDFLAARERLQLPVRKQHLLASDERWSDWLAFNSLSDPETFFIRRGTPA